MEGHGEDSFRPVSVRRTVTGINCSAGVTEEGKETRVQDEGGGGEKAWGQTVLHLATREDHQPRTLWLLSGKMVWRLRVVGR